MLYFVSTSLLYFTSFILPAPFTTLFLYFTSVLYFMPSILPLLLSTFLFPAAFPHIESPLLLAIFHTPLTLDALLTRTQTV